jgi:DNA-binding transcriptional LysR family regulator
MRPLAVLILLAGLLAGPAGAEERPSPLPPGDQDAIRGVIEGQLGAFRGNDAAAAFAYASPTIQQKFGSAELFIDMVRRGYATVFRPRSVAFGPLVEIDGAPVQKVDLIGPDGARGLALYYMEREADGRWRINGCVLTQSESVGA